MWLALVDPLDHPLEHVGSLALFPLGHPAQILTLV
jgi:hypothetical protein